MTHPSPIRAAALLLLGLGGCYTLPPQEDVTWIHYAPPAVLPSGTPRAERNRTVFDWVWATVNAHYYDGAFHGVDWPAARDRYRPEAEAATADEQLYGVINAMLGELKDGHTHALSPRAAEERREQRWVWIGLEYAPLQDSPEKVVVTYVWPGGPALEAGVQRGWVLETCDGQGAKSFLGAYLRDRRLAEGQKVQCVFRDLRDQPQSADLVARPVSRARIQEALGFWNQGAYLRFDGFKDADERWLYAQVRLHQDAPVLILDLRYNTGGEVANLEYMAGLFLPRGSALGTFFKRSGMVREAHARRPLLMPRFDGRLALIVSRNTASAAEIFASVLKRDRGCVVVGQRTAGEVLNAYEFELPDGGRLSVSIRDFLTPDGKRLEGAGVEPDADINYHLDELRAGRDPGIEAAVLALRRMAPRPNP